MLNLIINNYIKTGKTFKDINHDPTNFIQNEIVDKNVNKTGDIYYNKYYLSSTKEWYNSIYTYNKNNLIKLFVANNVVDKLIRSYFNFDMFNKQIKTAKYNRYHIKKNFFNKHMTLNRTLISGSEIKHTNDKILITIYLYNNNINLYMQKLNNLYKDFRLYTKSLINLYVQKYNYLHKKIPLTVNTNKRMKNKLNNYRSVIKNTRKNLYNNVNIIKTYKLYINNKSYKYNSINIYKNIIKSTSYEFNNFVFNNKKNIINSYYPTKHYNKTNTVGNLTHNLKSNFTNIHFSKAFSDFSKKVNITIKQKNKNNVYNTYSLNLNRYNLLYKTLYNNNRKINNSLLNQTLSIRKIRSAIYNKDIIYKIINGGRELHLKLLKLNSKDISLDRLNNIIFMFTKKIYNKEILCVSYMRDIIYNNFKYKNSLLYGLKKIISKIYKKKVEFNIVNLKYLYLNSDIFSESIAVKIRNRQNKLLRTLRKSLTLVRLPKRNFSFYYKNFINLLNKQNVLKLLINDNMSTKKDMLNNWLYTSFIYNDKHRINTFRKNNLQNIVIKSLRYKVISGVRIESAGRLTRRLTASRSLFKLKYKGNLKDNNSLNKLAYSSLLIGSNKPNIQFTKINSKTRNGSFGLKSWISGF